MEKYSVSLEKFIKNSTCEVAFTPCDPSDIYLTSAEVVRPGLMFAGYSKYFNPERVQFIGLAEDTYLESLPREEYENRLDSYMATRPAAVIVTRGRECSEYFLGLAKKYSVPVLTTAESTSSAMSAAISFLAVELAPRITRHGVLVEVSGEGVLILGDSGIGKSEAALELMKRGHRLIADDAVEIRRVSSKTLVGAAPDNIRHFIELHGVGVINALRLFGMGAVKMSEKIDMVVQLVKWQEHEVYERLGLGEKTTEILGIEVPIYVVPVKPGRNLSIIIEAAAMNNRQKRMGYDAAQELIKQLGLTDDIIPEKRHIDVWQEY